jgi:hypothetical protein
MAYNAVQQGAAGVDMGRNIFQSDAPQAMISAVHAVVHKNSSRPTASRCSRRSKPKNNRGLRTFAAYQLRCPHN